MQSPGESSPGKEPMSSRTLRSALLILGSLSLFSGCLGIPGRSTPLTQDSRERYQESVEIACDRIENTYWDPQAIEQRWEQGRLRWGQAMQDASTVEEARSALHGLLASLQLSQFA